MKRLKLSKNVMIEYDPKTEFGSYYRTRFNNIIIYCAFFANVYEDSILIRHWEKGILKEKKEDDDYFN